MKKYFIKYGFLSLIQNNYEMLLKIRDAENPLKFLNILYLLLKF